jgi:hypothetical protein
LCIVTISWCKDVAEVWWQFYEQVVPTSGADNNVCTMWSNFTFQVVLFSTFFWSTNIFSVSFTWKCQNTCFRFVPYCTEIWITLHSSWGFLHHNSSSELSRFASCLHYTAWLSDCWYRKYNSNVVINVILQLELSNFIVMNLHLHGKANLLKFITESIIYTPVWVIYIIGNVLNFWVQSSHKLFHVTLYLC